MKVKVRFAAVIDCNGEWAVAGISGVSDSENMFNARMGNNFCEVTNKCFIEAELDVPEVKTVQGDVVEVG